MLAPDHSDDEEFDAQGLRLAPLSEHRRSRTSSHNSVGSDSRRKTGEKQHQQQQGDKAEPQLLYFDQPQPDYLDLPVAKEDYPETV